MSEEKIKIAIVYFKECYLNDELQIVARSITDWAEVTNQQYDLLFRYLNGKYDYKTKMYTYVITIESNQGVIENKIDEILKRVEKEKRQREEQDRKYREIQNKREATKKAKQIEKAKKLLGIE